MALWIDDTLPDQDEWLDMTPQARAALIELWAYCKRARNNGVIKTTRLHKASDAYDGNVGKELIAFGWLHKDGTGCGTDTCPKGVDGVSVMHNFVRHQESAKDMSARIEARREGGRKGNHKRHHVEKNRHDPTCGYCTGDKPYEE